MELVKEEVEDLDWDRPWDVEELKPVPPWRRQEAALEESSESVKEEPVEEEEAFEVDEVEVLEQPEPGLVEVYEELEGSEELAAYDAYEPEAQELEEAQDAAWDEWHKDWREDLAEEEEEEVPGALVRLIKRHVGDGRLRFLGPSM